MKKILYAAFAFCGLIFGSRLFMKKILVVDDDEEILKVVNLVLGLNKFSVMATTKWQDINGLIRTFCPNLILLDILLKGADGREICEKLKKENATRSIPVVLFSAHLDFINHTEGCEADGVLMKPFDVFFLMETVRKNIA